jgi:hypothetical protein
MPKIILHLTGPVISYYVLTDSEMIPHFYSCGKLYRQSQYLHGICCRPFLLYNGIYAIAFVRLDRGNSGMYVTISLVAPIPTCIKPSSLVASNIGSTDATISWTAGEANPAGYEISYSTDPAFNPDTASLRFSIGDTNRYTFPVGTLSPTTTYYLYVRTLCGGNDTSVWNNTVLSFTTYQIPGTLPYLCDFENAAENANWQYVNLANEWIVGTATYSSPSHSLYVSNDGVNQGYGHNSSSIWAYRDIAFPIGNQFTLSFDWKGVGESTWDYMKVYIGDPTDVSSTLVANGPTGSINLGGVLSAQPNWTNYNIILDSTYSGTIKRVYFGWKEDGSMSNGLPAAVDNLMIDVITCPAVTAVTVPAATITVDSAVVNWTAGGNETDWIG